jgi:hypothetical protein
MSPFLISTPAAIGFFKHAPALHSHIRHAVLLPQSAAVVQDPHSSNWQTPLLHGAPFIALCSALPFEQMSSVHGFPSDGPWSASLLI